MKYNEYWAYEDILRYGYSVEVEPDRVTIRFEDGDVYADFRLKKDVEENYYWITVNDRIINEEVDFCETYDEAVCSCFYYFVTRF